MKVSIRKGIGFGLTSGVITTLGLIIGLNAGTGSKGVIIAGILIIAIADALSDSLGVHIAEEADRKKSQNQIWTATFSTFFSKLIVALTFLIPMLLFKLNVAIIVSIIWGLFLIFSFSYYIANLKKKDVWKEVTEHFVIAVVVIVLTHITGLLVNNFLWVI